MAHVSLPLTIVGFGAIVVAPAHAHDVAQARSAASAISLAIGIVLVAALALYAIGLIRVWKSAGVGHGIRIRAAVCFASACGVLAWASFGFLDALAQENFAAHMVQHELIMVVAAPLFVLGRPLGAWSWAFPMPARRRIGNRLRTPWLAHAWRVLTQPLTAWCLHTIALWMWHAPLFFRAAASSATLHALQHASFLLGALLFWWAALGKQGVRPGVALVMLFTTMVHTGALGALLFFSPADWYALTATPATLAEQQLGGLIMWVPGGTVYLVAALATAHRLLTASDKPMQYSSV